MLVTGEKCTGHKKTPSSLPGKIPLGSPSAPFPLSHLYGLDAKDLNGAKALIMVTLRDKELRKDEPTFLREAQSWVVLGMWSQELRGD